MGSKRVRHYKYYKKRVDSDGRQRTIRPCTQAEREMVEGCIPLALTLCSPYARDSRLGDDAVGVAYLALCLAAQNYDSSLGFHFNTHAGQTVKKRLRRAMRDKKHLRGVHRNDGGVAVVNVDLSRGNDSCTVDRRRQSLLDERDEVEWVMNKLSPEGRQVLRMRFWDDMDMTQMGRIKAVSKQAVHSYVQRLLAEVRLMLTTARQEAEL